MTSQSAKKIIKEILNISTINIGDENPWDIQIHNDNFYQRILDYYSLGLGETYMDGWWDCAKLDEFFFRLLRTLSDGNEIHKLFYNKAFVFAGIRWVGQYLRSLLSNRQSRANAMNIGEKHYDVGNDLFQRMLDKEMNYTCGYWRDADNLDDAQIAKLKLICEKLELKPGEEVLDIGCGWGSFARYAARHYDVSVVGITVSQQQKVLAEKRCADYPIEIRIQDYRALNETFDKIVSIGMFEHVGYKNYRRYMQVASQCLKDDGLFLLHTIGSNTSLVKADPWIDKYIFPGGMIPSIKQIGSACEKIFVMEDWHNFGADYDKTLMSWYANFNHHWDEIKQRYDERFRRMWNYYLLSCAGGFRSRDLQLWQIVLSKKGILGGYRSIR